MVEKQTGNTHKKAQVNGRKNEGKREGKVILYRHKLPDSSVLPNLYRPLAPPPLYYQLFPLIHALQEFIVLAAEIRPPLKLRLEKAFLRR